MVLKRIINRLSNGTPKRLNKDYKQALKWYTKAAEQGFADAQIILGTMYAKGEGVEQDYEQSFKWFTKAAEQGFAKAQFGLALMHISGQGTNEDYVEAYKWVLLAEMNNYGEAIKLKDLLKEKMNPSQIGEAKKKANEFFVSKKKENEE